MQWGTKTIPKYQSKYAKSAQTFHFTFQSICNQHFMAFNIQYKCDTLPCSTYTHTRSHTLYSIDFKLPFDVYIKIGFDKIGISLLVFRFSRFLFLFLFFFFWFWILCTAIRTTVIRTNNICAHVHVLMYAFVDVSTNNIWMLAVPFDFAICVVLIFVVAVFAAVAAAAAVDIFWLTVEISWCSSRLFNMKLHNNKFNFAMILS